MQTNSCSPCFPRKDPVLSCLSCYCNAALCVRSLIMVTRDGSTCSPAICSDFCSGADGSGVYVCVCVRVSLYHTAPYSE